MRIGGTIGITPQAAGIIEMVTQPLIYCKMTGTILSLDDCVILEVDAPASEALHESGLDEAKLAGYVQAYDIPEVQDYDMIEL